MCRTSVTSPGIMAIERKYQMVRVGEGDYLLPSNDGKTLWRIYTYEEDGTAEVSADGKKWRTLKGTFWSNARCNVPLKDVDPQSPDLLDWSNWTTWSATMTTRKVAIQDALRVTSCVR